METVASLAAAMSKKSAGNRNRGLPQEQLNSIVELVSKPYAKNTIEKVGKRKKKILWVDDRPENNVFERKAFESQDIESHLASSTIEPLELLKNNQYSAVISDMGRKEGAQEGYVLLGKVREYGNNIPFFIYAGSDASAHETMALERGAQGSTNRPQELYEMVMNTVRE